MDKYSDHKSPMSIYNRKYSAISAAHFITYYTGSENGREVSIGVDIPKME